MARNKLSMPILQKIETKVPKTKIVDCDKIDASWLLYIHTRKTAFWNFMQVSQCRLAPWFATRLCKTAHSKPQFHC